MPIASAIDIFNFTIKLYPHQIRARQATEQKKLVFDEVFEKASNPRRPESQGYPPGNHAGYLVYLFTLAAPGQLRVRLQARAAEAGVGAGGEGAGAGVALRGEDRGRARQPLHGGHLPGAGRRRQDPETQD